MALLWTLHELLTLVMFWNLPALHLQEQLETISAESEVTQPVNVSEAQPVALDTEIASRDCAISPAVLFIPQEPVQVTPSVVHHTPPAKQQLDISDTSSITMSNECIEEAEVFMHADQDVEAATAAVLDTEAVQHLSWPCDAVSPISRTNSDSFLQRRRQHYGTMNRDDVILPTNDGQTAVPELSAVRDAEVPQTVRETSVQAAEPELPSSSLTWQYYYDGQSSDEMT